MVRAVWNEKVLAESDDCKIVDRNFYFPPDSVHREYLKQSDTQTTCIWKGRASYYDIEVDGKTLRDAAWYYPEPRRRASNIKGYVAFWKEVAVQDK